MRGMLGSHAKWILVIFLALVGIIFNFMDVSGTGDFGKTDSKTPLSKETKAHREHKQNRLVHEKSPCLLQHADNPVD